ncbi:MAG TPA: hypothetical protein VGB24_16780 [Longimicrobium sp.]|jgi:hypothetical protein|uniref:hypothetical protein n=1 Tax=Longimicrobium sp. TaxID=2029185 RepID=UPI002ED7F93B
MRSLLISAVAAALLVFGGAQELYVRGIQGGEVQPFWTGVWGAGSTVALLLAAAARWRRVHWATTAVRAAALLVIAVHLYGAMNADRNVGPFAALVAIGWSAGMLLVTLRRGDGAVRPSRAAAR